VNELVAFWAFCSVVAVCVTAYKIIQMRELKRRRE
jgi:hypothetical protein